MEEWLLIQVDILLLENHLERLIFLLRNACDYVTKDNVLNKILLTDEYFKKWGWKSPRIGVAALNPHASDGGLLGDEEKKQILQFLQPYKRLTLVDGHIHLCK